MQQIAGTISVVRGQDVEMPVMDWGGQIYNKRKTGEEIILKMRGFSALQRTDRRSQTGTLKYTCVDTQGQNNVKATQTSEASNGKEPSPASLDSGSTLIDPSKNISQINQPQGHSTSGTTVINDRSPTSAHSSFIKSANEVLLPTDMRTSNGHTEQSNSTGQTESRDASKNLPWYVTVLHEKEKCVLMLEDKIKHLSVFEAESRRKDGVIAALRDEVAALTQQLSVTMDNDILRTQVQTILMLQDEIDCLKVFEAESQRKDCVIAGLREQIWQLGLQISQLNEDTSIHTTSTTREDISKHETKERELETESKISGTPVEKSSKEKLKEKGKEENSKKIVLNGEGQGEEDEHGREEKEVVEPEGESPSKPESVDHDKDNNLAMEDEKLKELTNLISQNEELKKQLTEMKEGYNMSTGAVVSINRELSLAEAQLRNTEAEVERLQKDLKERCIQLQDMSNKFSNLKEENNHIKIMADLQKENFNFRELVSELQSGLKERNEVITGLKGEIDKLQLHITDGEVKLKRLQMECDDATTNGDFLQHELQQLQIALKFTGTRLERFVSKIIQAVYTTPGIVQPTVQISDDDTLDVFQKILDDRLEFHRLLTENGIAVPPLFVTENPDESQTAP